MLAWYSAWVLPNLCFRRIRHDRRPPLSGGFPSPCPPSPWSTHNNREARIRHSWNCGDHTARQLRRYAFHSPRPERFAGGVASIRVVRFLDGGLRAGILLRRRIPVSISIAEATGEVRGECGPYSGREKRDVEDAWDATCYSTARECGRGAIAEGAELTCL